MFYVIKHLTNYLHFILTVLPTIPSLFWTSPFSELLRGHDGRLDGLVIIWWRLFLSFHFSLEFQRIVRRQSARRLEGTGSCSRFHGSRAIASCTALLHSRIRSRQGIHRHSYPSSLVSLPRQHSDVRRSLSRLLEHEVDQWYKCDYSNETGYHNNFASGCPCACFASVCLRLFVRRRFSFRGGIGLMNWPKFFRVGLGRCKRGRFICLHLTVSKSSKVITFLAGSAIVVVDTRTIMMPNAIALAASSIAAFAILDAVSRIDTQGATGDQGKEKRE